MKCTGLPHCHLVVMSKHSLLTCCPVPVTLTILPLQLTWSGLGQLESLTKLRSLSLGCNFAGKLPAGAPSFSVHQ